MDILDEFPTSRLDILFCPKSGTKRSVRVVREPLLDGHESDDEIADLGGDIVRQECLIKVRKLENQGDTWFGNHVNHEKLSRTIADEERVLEQMRQKLRFLKCANRASETRKESQIDFPALLIRRRHGRTSTSSKIGPCNDPSQIG